MHWDKSPWVHRWGQCNLQATWSHGGHYLFFCLQKDFQFGFQSGNHSATLGSPRGGLQTILCCMTWCFAEHAELVVEAAFALNGGELTITAQLQQEVQFRSCGGGGRGGGLLLDIGGGLGTTRVWNGWGGGLFVCSASLQMHGTSTHGEWLWQVWSLNILLRLGLLGKLQNSGVIAWQKGLQLHLVWCTLVKSCPKIWTEGWRLEVGGQSRVKDSSSSREELS